jgi:hypothetical protein
MPVSVEQIAVAVRQMDVEERRRLIDLVPELREALSSERTVEQARRSAQALREEVLEGVRGEYLKPDEPFLGGFTLEAYWRLSDEERERLWAEWAGEDWDTVEEIDVSLSALSA